MNKNVALLAVCQALLQSGNALLITSSALVGLALAPSPAYATVALGVQFMVTASLTLPASLLMQRIGRRLGFSLGAGLGFIGGGLFSAGIYGQSYTLFCLGAGCFGAFNAFGQYYRFAAADVASRDYRSRAISLVLAGGLVAAVLGPNLAHWTRELIVTHSFLGSYLCLLALTLSTAVVLGFIDIPKPSAEELGHRERTLLQIALQPRYLVAVMGAMVAYGMMNLLMVATPLAMTAEGLPFHQAASVIQWHIIAMYVPAFFTGHLIHRFGTLNIILLGIVVLGACVVVSLSGLGPIRYWIALILLGLGWNFAFTGATTLLTLTYSPEEKALAQGFNDLLVFTTMTLTAAVSGAVHAHFGWDALNVSIVPFLVLTFVFTAWLRLRERPAQELSTR